MSRHDGTITLVCLDRQSRSANPTVLGHQSKVDSREFRNHTEVVNDALRKVREMESGIAAIRRRLIAAENSGFTDMTVDEIWEASRIRGVD